MTKKPNTKRTQLKDLLVAQQELSPAEARNIKGGVGAFSVINCTKCGHKHYQSEPCVPPKDGPN